MPAASSAGIDRAAEHDRAERVGDVPQGLREARGDRVDTGRPDADEQVEEEGIGAELESLGKRAGQHARPEPELLDEERARRAQRRRSIPPGGKDDGQRRRDQRHEIAYDRDVERQARHGRRGDDECQQGRPPQEADRVVGDDLAAAEQGVQAEGEEQLSGDRKRAVQELGGRQVGDQLRQRATWPDIGWKAVQPACDHDRQPTDDDGPQHCVGEPPPGVLATPAGDDAQGGVHSPRDDDGRELREEEDEGEATLRAGSEETGKHDVGGQDEDGQPKARPDRQQRIPGKPAARGGRLTLP